MADAIGGPAFTHFLALEGGEIMAAVQIATMGELPFSALRDGIIAHLTLAESFNNLFVSVDG